MATIKDVASHAGVSIATVSNYLNKTKPVSKKLSIKIQDAIDALKYSQNISAKNLKSNKYNDIGIILPTFDDPYYVQIFQGIELALQNSDYFLNLAFSYDIPEIEQNIVRNFRKKNICGLILMSCQPGNMEFYYENLVAYDKPIILIDRNIDNLDANFISFDNYSTIRYITTSLIEKGHYNLYLFTGPEEYYSEMQCIKGFRHAFKSSDIELKSDAIQTTKLNREDAFRQTVQLLKKDIPDVIITTSETSATGIMEGLQILGYDLNAIPVITLGEEHWNKHTHSFASLSTIRPAIYMGKTAAELLIRKLQSPQIQENEKIILKDRVLNEDITLYESNDKIDVTEKEIPVKNNEINVLMLDTPQVHALNSLLKNFEKSTGIKVTINILPHHRLLNEILRSFDSDDEGASYDVYMFDIPWLYSLASYGLLYDLSDIIQCIEPDLFFPDCLEYFSRYKDRYYSIPFMYAPQVFYYRKDLFNNPALQNQYEKIYSSKLRPPLTWKEFNVISEFFTTKTDVIPYGLSIPAAYNEFLSPEIYMRLNAYGSKIYDNDNKIVFNSPQTLKAYASLDKSFKYSKPNAELANDITTVYDFLNGETAMLISYPSFLMEVVDLRNSSMIGSIGYAHIPGGRPVLGGWSLGINSKSAKTDAAFRFIKWACTGEMSNYFSLLGGQSLITKTYTNDELVKLYPWLPLYYSTYKNTLPIVPPCLDNGAIIPQSEIDNILCDGVRMMISEKADAIDIIQQAHNNFKELFKKFS